MIEIVQINNSKGKHMKIISFIAIKGGVGKTTLTFNFGEWLAEQGYKVLLIDADSQCNLSQTYNVYTSNGTIGEIFYEKGDRVNFIHLKQNISLIAGDVGLDQANYDIFTKVNKERLMYMWLRDNYESQLKEYDYLLIDCHPDFSVITQNMVIVSDFVLSPIEPSEFGFAAKANLEVRFNHLKSEASFVTAKLKFIANRVKHNTKSSKEFLEAVKNYEDIIAIIPEKELFNRSTLDYKSLADMEKNTMLKQKNKEFFDSINKTFEDLLVKIEEE